MTDANYEWLSDKERRRLTRIPSDRAVVATLATTGLIAAFMQTLVTPVIPHLPQLLNTDVANAQWVLTSTLLAAAVTTPISGRLGDMFGKKRVALALLAVMVLGSVISALSFSLIPMLVGRTLQGASLGLIALGISILRDVLHPKRLPAAVALVSATLGIGGAIGLPISALIAENLDWHFLFWLSALLAVVAFGLVFWIVPESTLRTAGRFDWIGAVGLGAGLVAILLPVSKGIEWGWTSPLTLGMLGGGVLILVVWGLFELRTVDPLVDLRVTARRPVLFTNLASIMIGFTFFATAASLPVLLESPTSTGVGLGQTLLIASLALMPTGVVMFFVSPYAARLSTARGPRTSLMVGAAIIAIAYTLGFFLMSEVWHIILMSTIVGVGVGFAYAAMPTLIMHSVPPTETAAANSLNSVMRTLGSTSAAAFVGIILSTHAVNRQGVSIPTQGAFQVIFLVAAGIAVLGVVLASFIPRRDRRYEDTSSIPIQSLGA